MTTRIARILIEYLNRKYPYLCREIVVPPDAHIHKNPKKLKPVRYIGPIEPAEQAGHDFGGQI